MISAILRVALFFLVVAGSAFPVSAREFKVIGPGGGGAMYLPSISPHDANTVLVRCDMTGAYITHDGGKSWRMFNLRGVVQFFVFDAVDPKTIYAQATGLWRSTDNGGTWNLVYPRPSAIKGIQMSSDHANETIIADPDPLGTITAMATDPADSRTLFIVAGHTDNSALFASHDYGATWQQEGVLHEKGSWLWVDPSSPRNARSVYIGEAHGVEVRTASGIKRFPAPESVAFSDMSAGFVAGHEPTIYATSGQGVFVSHDGGTTWQKCVLPGTGARVRAVATSSGQPATAYVSYRGLSLDQKSWMGIAKSTDGGSHWQLIWKDSDAAAPNVHDAWITERFGSHWGDFPIAIGVAPQDANLAYFTDLGATMKSSDGGANWTAVYSHRVGNGAWNTTGLDVTTSYGVHFDPFDPKREFITYTDIGLFRSEDGGNSWQSSTSGVPKEWLNTTYWIVFDPQVKGRVWSVNSYTHDLPRPKMWRGRSSLMYKGGVCVSEDGGKTWTKSNSGMDETAATFILLDPTSPPDARVLYVTGFGRGVYKSTDSGKTWKLKNSGITQKEPFAWRLTRASDGTLYVLIARRSQDGSIGNEEDGALYRSTDGAESWSAVSLPKDVNGPNGLAIDPKSPERMYLAAWARDKGTHGEGGGIYVTDNGGKSWRHVLDRDQHVYDVTIDPRHPNILYSSGFESSAWRSTDRGEHWNRIPGFNFKWGHRVIPDPADENSIYVTTFGGSVWHGPVNGKAQPLDIETPEMDPGR